MRRFIARSVIAMICMALVALAIFAGLGGLTIANGWRFECEPIQQTVPGSAAGVWVDTQVRSVSIRGIQLYVRSSLPYSIPVVFSIDESNSPITRATIDDAAIRYQNGESKQL